MRDLINIILENQSIPPILYHGSPHSFKTFEPGHRNGMTKPRTGFYFTDDEEVVREFFGKPMGYHVVFHNAADFQYGSGDSIVDKVLSLNPELRYLIDEVDERYGDHNRIAQKFTSMGFLQSGEFISTLMELGYDGMIFDDLMSQTPFTSYVAFSADQITQVGIS